MKLAFLIFYFCMFDLPASLAQEDHSEHVPTKGSSSDQAPIPSEGHQHSMGTNDCSEMQVWEPATAMCAPLPMPGMPMKHLMVHGNGFIVRQTAQGPRGRDTWTSPNMIMGDLGTSVGDRHYLNLNLMLTTERWTFPEEGYPELFQIGEENSKGQPYIDAQHPHNSPIMGLTISDTIKIGSGKDHIKIFFAPRGEATDGPVAFMHRPTGMVNPDAPLGHHLGQDISHITSTVLGASIRLNKTTVQASAFNGLEPLPTKTDLPLGPLNSAGARIIYEFSPQVTAMSSWSYVKEPEHDDPTLESVKRISASIYNNHQLSPNWMFQNSLIYGQIQNYDHVPVLSSITEEFLFDGMNPKIWGRLELVQRTPGQLAILNISDLDSPRWITAMTAGYTHVVMRANGFEIGAGASVTKNFLPDELRVAYGGEPWSSKVFLQVSGMGSREL